jgi:pantothenate kinase type III
MGIGVRYPKPESIGPDRLANAVALAHLHGAPGIVIDFGTAVTFDILSADKHYIGGVIAPGLRHFWARYAPGRLYDVPVTLGWLPRATAEDALNPRVMFL